MNIEALSGGQALFQMMGSGGAGRQGPPSGDDIAATINDAISSGHVDGAEIQSRLSERFGEDAEGILQEDGSLDTEKLSSFLEANRPAGLQQFAGTDESELVQTLLDSLEESDENTDATPSLIEQLYGQASGGTSTNEELFSILA